MGGGISRPKSLQSTRGIKNRYFSGMPAYPQPAYGETRKPARELNPEELQHLLNKLSSDESKELKDIMQSCTSEVSLRSFRSSKTLSDHFDARRTIQCPRRRLPVLCPNPSARTISFRTERMALLRDYGHRVANGQQHLLHGQVQGPNHAQNRPILAESW